MLEHVPVESALDAGCGAGGWLATLQQLGVDDFVGIDGAYLDRATLEIPPEHFLALDLVEPFDLGRGFDLVLSLEVAEHLPAAAADGFVASLVRHAPVVLFSAAVPHQPGIGHVNAQWPDYWAAKFAVHEYVPVDNVRPSVWADPSVEPWYAQNTLLFAHEKQVPESLGQYVVRDPGRLPIVHPWFFESAMPLPVSRRRLLLEGLVGVEAATRVRRRLGRA
ncbi:MAG TPA: class I SAM-dependent methyltransferase [Gaiellaceae bacterium]|nr:class I SAM-dependent methyltransferase [Gaiellaceae bacterium]